MKLLANLGVSRYEADEAYKQALAAFRQQNFEQALTHINEAVARHPRQAEYHAALGWFQLERGDQASARAGFDRARRINAYEMLANYGLGMLAYQDKRWQEAAGYFLDAIAAQPDRPETMYYLALVRHRQGDNERAMHWMRKAGAALSADDAERARQCQAWLREFAQLVEAQ